jgi:hypothetical protein
VLSVVAAPRAYADSHFSFYFGVEPAPVVVAPLPVIVRPAPVIVAPAPVTAPYEVDDDCYWQPGYYASTGFGYRWVPGRWVRRADQPYRPTWPRPRWDRDNHERWDRGRWEHERWNRERDDDDRDY